MLSRADFEKTQLQEARRADRKRADDEKRRRDRKAWEKWNSWNSIPLAQRKRLLDLQERRWRLVCWADGECWLTGEDIPLPTDPKKIRRFRRTMKKLDRAIRREETRIGTLHDDDYDKVLAFARSAGFREPFDEEAARQIRAEREAETQRMLQTPEGRATLEAWDRWAKHRDWIYGDIRRSGETEADSKAQATPVKTMAAHA